MSVHVNFFAYLFHLINQTAAFSPTCHEQFWISRIFGLVITLFSNYIHFSPFSLLIASPELGVWKCIKLIFHYLKIAFFIDNLLLTTPRHTAQSPPFDLITLLGAFWKLSLTSIVKGKKNLYINWINRELIRKRDTVFWRFRQCLKRKSRSFVLQLPHFVVFLVLCYEKQSHFAIKLVAPCIRVAP